MRATRAPDSVSLVVPTPMLTRSGQLPTGGRWAFAPKWGRTEVGDAVARLVAA